MERINTAVTYTNAGTSWFNPVQLSSNTLHKIGVKAHNIQNVLNVLKQLSPDNYLQYIMGYYANGLEKFGDAWGYCDLLTILYAAASALKPTNYLEIGVRRGRSLAVTVAAHPAVNIYGFDLWMQNYAGMDNPGPEFVKEELKKLNHTGKLTLISGDSKLTVPQFIHSQPELYFDLITVDGDHSKEGARIDLENVLTRLKIGGVILLDDICHPQHEYLDNLWDELITNDKNFLSKKYSELGYGIAFAIKRNYDQ